MKLYGWLIFECITLKADWGMGNLSVLEARSVSQ